jgi:hypothetical protein
MPAIARARFSTACHLFEGYRGLILRVAAPVFTPQPPVLRNNRKLLGRPGNRFESQSIFQRPAAQDLSKACFGLKFSKNSLFLSWRPVSLDCIRHHPVADFCNKIGTFRTWLIWPRMSAIGGEADKPRPTCSTGENYFGLRIFAPPLRPPDFMGVRVAFTTIR